MRGLSSGKVNGPLSFFSYILRILISSTSLVIFLAAVFLPSCVSYFIGLVRHETLSQRSLYLLERLFSFTPVKLYLGALFSRDWLNTGPFMSFILILKTELSRPNVKALTFFHTKAQQLLILCWSKRLAALWTCGIQDGCCWVIIPLNAAKDPGNVWSVQASSRSARA